MTHLKFAQRTLKRLGTSVLIKVFCLALGIAASSVIFFWAYNELSYDNFHKNADRIFRVTGTTGSASGDLENKATVAFPIGHEAVQSIPEVEWFTQANKPLQKQIFKHGENFFVEDNCLYVDASWFDFFDYRFKYGTKQNFDGQPLTIVLSEKTAAKYFGDFSDPVGQSIYINGEAYEIKGVLGESQNQSVLDFDSYISLTSSMRNPLLQKVRTSWTAEFYISFVSLHPTANINTVAEKMTELARSNRSVGGNEYNINLISLENMYLDQSLDHDVFPHRKKFDVYLFIAIGIIILIISIFNYFCLVLSEISTRSKEILVKKINGASTRGLGIQFFWEAALQSALGVVLAAGLLALVGINKLLPYDVSSLFIQPSFYIILVVVFALITIIAGLYPLMLVFNTKIHSLLDTSKSVVFGNNTTQRVLTTIQFTVSLTVLIAAMVMQAQWSYMYQQHTRLGPEQVIAIKLPTLSYFNSVDSAANLSAVRTFKNNVSQLASIRQVSMASESILDANNAGEWGLNWDGKAPSYDPVATLLRVDEAFFDFFNLEMVDGRWFDNSGGDDIPGIILNESAIKGFEIRNPVLGQRFYYPDEFLKEHNASILGVVGDFHYKSLYDPILPLVITYSDRPINKQLFVKVNGAENTHQLLQSIEKLWKRQLSDLPFEHYFLDEQFNAIYAAERATKQTFNIFSAITVLISCLGIFALASYQAKKQLKNMAIRKIIGANHREIALIMGKDYLIISLISTLSAFPLAWILLKNWLENFAYPIELLPMHFLLPGLLILFVVIVSVYYHIAKVVLAKPAQVLRSE